MAPVPVPTARPRRASIPTAAIPVKPASLTTMSANLAAAAYHRGHLPARPAAIAITITLA